MNAVQNGPYRLVTDIDEAWECARREQVRIGKNEIGTRKTPIISYWPMLKKWEKFGSWFTYIGTDGDVDLVKYWWCDLKEKVEVEYGTISEPLMLQLFYQVMPDGQVAQLAWIRPDIKFEYPRWIESEKLTIHLLH